jgi:hypothetical protein
MGLDARVEERPDIGDDSLQVRQLTAREAAGLKVELTHQNPAASVVVVPSPHIMGRIRCRTRATWMPGWDGTIGTDDHRAYLGNHGWAPSKR